MIRKGLCLLPSNATYCEVITPNEATWEICILPVEALNVHMDKPIMTIATENRRVSTLESKYRFKQQLFLQQHIITPHHYNYISLQHNIVTTEYRCNNIPLKHHIVQIGYRYNSIYRQNISIHHIVRTASFDHWKHGVVFFSI